MMGKSGRLPRPVLKFKGGTSIYPFKGLSLGFKPLRGPSEIKLGLLWEKKVSGKAEELLDLMLNGYKSFKGMTEVFDVDVSVEKLEVNTLEEAHKELEKFEGFDVCMVAIPDEISLPEDMDYYIPFKQQAASVGVPSQMVTYSTLQYGSKNVYVLFNLALNLYGKAGGVAWGLAEKLSSEVFIGVDVAGSYVVASLFVEPGNPRVGWFYEFNPEVEVAVSVREVVLRALRAAYRFLGRALSSVVVQRDGRAHWSEVEALRSAFSEAKSKGWFKEDGYYAYLEVKKRVGVRVIRKRGGRLLNPDKGVYLWLTKNTLLVTTTGAPERPLPSQSGLVKPIALTLVDTSNWERSILDLSKDTYWLSQLHWGSAFVTPRLPITTLYAHKVAHLLSLGAYPPPEYAGTLWFL